ncbi:SET domain-containing protein [Rhizoctonia solani AG-1 IA]|uniref:SET domain-containing protein n=1 Tax=Thanatephorus cucumeris (strain AG1-IA) TaxID=983506 RepID=L8X3C0_THACA|nr:SET domain-containing protein [Rhizoctonia solani AG-1 IA]
MPPPVQRVMARLLLTGAQDVAPSSQASCLWRASGESHDTPLCRWQCFRSPERATTGPNNTHPTTMASQREDTSGISVFASSNLSHSDLGEPSDWLNTLVVNIDNSNFNQWLKSPNTALYREKHRGSYWTHLILSTQGSYGSGLILEARALGEQSAWAGYLQSLPREQVPVAALWDENEDKDSQHAWLWLQATETAREIHELSTGCTISQTISNFYYQVANPTLNQAGHKATLDDFRRAWSLVSSRSFRVDSYHGLAMVPIADAFNHIGENQTDFDVCPICGSLQSCPHDEEEIQGSSNLTEGKTVLENTCDMVMNAPVSTGDEIFNSYDTSLPNSTLLARYGFILEGNEHDYVSWDTTHLPPSMQGCTASLLEELAGTWTEELLNASSLVYDFRNPFGSSVHTDSTLYVQGPAHRVPCYRINSDGLVTIELWVTAAVCSVKATSDNDLGLISKSSLGRLATTQVAVENNEDVDLDPDNLATTLLQLRILANLLQNLCRSRLEGMYMPELSISECGDLLDSLPATMVRSRMAVSQALSERATLIACRDGWDGLIEQGEPVPEYTRDYRRRLNPQSRLCCNDPLLRLDSHQATDRRGSSPSSTKGKSRWIGYAELHDTSPRSVAHSLAQGVRRAPCKWSLTSSAPLLHVSRNKREIHSRNQELLTSDRTREFPTGNSHEGVEQGDVSGITSTPELYSGLTICSNTGIGPSALYFGAAIYRTAENNRCIFECVGIVEKGSLCFSRLEKDMTKRRVFGIKMASGSIHAIYALHNHLNFIRAQCKSRIRTIPTAPFNPDPDVHVYLSTTTLNARRPSLGHLQSVRGGSFVTSGLAHVRLPNLGYLDLVEATIYGATSADVLRSGDRSIIQVYCVPGDDKGVNIRVIH